MSLKWRAELNTGLDWQDKQHRQIFKKIDKLLDAMQQNEGACVVKELIAFLGKYTQSHFCEKEEYMFAHNSTTYARHKKSILSSSTSLRN